MSDTIVSHRRNRLTAAACGVLLLVAVGAAQAQPFTWLVPMGGETWSTEQVHTVMWSGGPASPVNVQLAYIPTNSVAQTIALGAVNDGEVAFRLSASLVPGPYLVYIEDVAQTTWAYGPQFTVRRSAACNSPCTSAAFGAPLVVCGQTLAEADSLAVALAQSHIACGMAGNVDPGSIQIETTLLSVGPFNCPPGYGGAYAVEVSALWCCCPEPVGAESKAWSAVKSLYRD